MSRPSAGAGAGSENTTRPRGFDDFDLKLGDVMRGERATLGKSLLDVQRELKIKASYIAAIENADPSVFETQGFIAGYVRSYARYLGLEPDWAYDAFRREGGLAPIGAGTREPKKVGARLPEQRDPFGNPRAPFIPSERPLFSGFEPRAVTSVAVLAALIGIIGYGGWAVLQEVQKVRFVPIDQAPEVVADLDPLSRAVTPEVDAAGQDVAAVTAEALDRLYRPKALDVPVLVPRDGPIAGLDPATVGALAPEMGGETMLAARTPVGGGSEALPQSPLERAVAEAMTSESEVPVVTEQVEAPELMLVAVQPSWVRVRAGDGTVIFEKILDANEEYVLPEVEGVPTLRAGNAGSLYFAVNGQTYGPAGQGPSVVKNVPLTPDDVTQTFALADPESDVNLARYYAEVRDAQD
nr:helix-turn-helix domain-containing protein [Roseitranquillus sediminis]